MGDCGELEGACKLVKGEVKGGHGEDLRGNFGGDGDEWIVAAVVGGLVGCWRKE